MHSSITSNEQAFRGRMESFQESFLILSHSEKVMRLCL
jgi:hypothetical protein